MRSLRRSRGLMCVFLLSSCVVASQFLTEAKASWSSGYQGAVMLRDCSVSPSGPCIESIIVTDRGGTKIRGVLTGRTANEFYISGDLRFADEYQFAGMEFEYPAENRMINRTYFDGQRIQVVLEASWLDRNPDSLPRFQILMPKRETNLWCGTTQNPSYCYRSVNFDSEFDVEVRLQIPKSFVVAYVNGRGQKLKVEIDSATVMKSSGEFQILSLALRTQKMSQMNWSDLIPNPLQSSEWAEWESDQTNVFIYSSSHPVTMSLGRCAGTPSVSVVSNGFYADVPVWDASANAMSVKVSAPHYRTNGELNLGFFQTQISAQLARCLWGIDLSHHTRAEVSVSESTTGSQEVQTVVGGFDGQMFTLTASNFHFSSPTVSVKLLQGLQSSVGAVHQPSRSCVKGNLVRKKIESRLKCSNGLRRRM